MLFTQVAAIVAASVSVVSAQVPQGFNYGSTFTTGAAKRQADFETEFNAAKGLVGHSFSSARLYTCIQAGTASNPIEAIPAAISTKTTLLLGLWASAGQAQIDNELAALQSAIDQYGSAFLDLVVGISVGSEDLYRISPTGIINKSGVGAEPFQLVSYINQLRQRFPSINKPVGHVDTWNDWVNGSNSAVVDAVDFIGYDAYPYFETTLNNPISNGANLFQQSYDATVAAAKGKPVWITETGWPVSGPLSGQAVASVANAKTFWDAVACKVLGNVPTFWYTLQDAAPDTPSPSFGLVGAGALSANPQPLYDLTCPGGSSAVSSAASSAGQTSIPVAPVSSGSLSSVQLASTPTSIVGTPAPTQASGQVITVKSTVWSTVTATACDEDSYDVTVTVKSTAYVTECGSCAASTPVPAPSNTTPVSSGTPAPAPKPSATAGACPADLNGNYEYPHLIIPVDKSQPTKAPGTSYFGYVNSTVSTIFNFDIPASYAGKTCTLLFLFPLKSQLETTDSTLKGSGGLVVNGLVSPATEQTSYANAPAVASQAGSVANLTPGNSYTITSGACPAGQRVAYEISATGGVDLSWFNDWNPSPLGLFIRTC